MIAFLFKILATLTSLAATILLTVESVRRGLLVASTIFGLMKIIVIIVFCGLLLLILYLLFKSYKSADQPS